MSGIGAVFYRDYRQRMTNIGFLFWDMFVPLAYLILFGLGFERMLGGGVAVGGEAFGYTAFLLPGVLGMVTFSVAMNTSWGFFMDKDSGIFYDWLSLPQRAGSGPRAGYHVSCFGIPPSLGIT